MPVVPTVWEFNTLLVLESHKLGDRPRVAPMVVGPLNVQYLPMFFLLQETVEAWRTVFYISAAVYTFGTIFYGLFGSGEIQPWAMPKNKNNTKLQLFVDKDKEKYEEEMGIPRVA